MSTASFEIMIHIVYPLIDHLKVAPPSMQFVSRFPSMFGIRHHSRQVFASFAVLLAGDLRLHLPDLELPR
jgi:hypothetical protein